MKHYVEPEINVFALNSEDVIATSSIGVSDMNDCDYKSWDGIVFS